MEVVYKKTAAQKVKKILQDLFDKGGEEALNKIDYIRATQAEVNELWGGDSFRDKSKWSGCLTVDIDERNYIAITVSVRVEE